MKILLKKILESLILAVLVLIIVIGNVILIYNIRNSYVDINKKLNINMLFLNSKYIEITDVERNSKIEIFSKEDKEKLIETFNQIKVRESKFNILDKNQKYEYTIYIISSDEKEENINISDREIMVYNSIYSSDMNMEDIFNIFFKELEGE